MKKDRLWVSGCGAQESRIRWCWCDSGQRYNPKSLFWPLYGMIMSPCTYVMSLWYLSPPSSVYRKAVDTELTNLFYITYASVLDILGATPVSLRTCLLLGSCINTQLPGSGFLSAQDVPMSWTGTERMLGRGGWVPLSTPSDLGALSPCITFKEAYLYIQRMNVIFMSFLDFSLPFGSLMVSTCGNCVVQIAQCEEMIITKKNT